MPNNKDLEAPWIGRDKLEKEKPKVRFRCEWCDEYVFYGEDYFDINGEKVCVECISDCKRSG